MSSLPAANATITAVAQLTVAALTSLDQTVVPNILLVVEGVLGVIGNVLVLAVFCTSKVFTGHHYSLLKVLAVSNSLRCVTCTVEMSRRLYEWMTRSPLLLTKFVCNLVMPQVGDSWAKWLHFFIATDRIIALKYPIVHRDKGTWALWFAILFPLIWELTEWAIVLQWAYDTNQKLPLCILSLIKPEVYIAYAWRKDIIFCVSYLLSYGLLLVVLQQGINKATKSGNEAVRQARKSMQQKLIKAQVIDAAFCVATFLSSTLLRALYIDGASATVKLVSGAWVNLLVNVAFICNLALYYAVNTTFRHAFNVMLTGQKFIGQKTTINTVTTHSLPQQSIQIPAQRTQIIVQEL